MCNSKDQHSPTTRIVKAARVKQLDLPNIPARYVVRPATPAYVVRLDEDGNRVLAEMRWDLVPPWVKDIAEKYHMTNARAEDILDKVSYSKPLRAGRRCLVPVDGFYEYPEGKAPKGELKQPYYFTRADGEMLVMAGLWESWKGPPGEPLEQPLLSYTIVTTAAPKSTTHIHKRIPVILHDEAQFERWLDPGAAAEDLKAELLVTPPDDLVKVWPIKKGVLTVKNPGPEILEPIAL